MYSAVQMLNLPIYSKNQIQKLAMSDIAVTVAPRMLSKELYTEFKKSIAPEEVFLSRFSDQLFCFGLALPHIN